MFWAWFKENKITILVDSSCVEDVEEKTVETIYEKWPDRVISRPISLKQKRAKYSHLAYLHGR